MTEVEWLVCKEPREMLMQLASNQSDRKMRLFGCACVRHSWDDLLVFKQDWRENSCCLES